MVRDQGCDRGDDVRAVLLTSEAASDPPLDHGPNDVSIRGVSDAGAALAELETGSVDCLVLETPSPAPLDRFAADVAERFPGVRIVRYGGPTAEGDGAALEHADTVVEKREDGDDGPLLRRKIRAAVQGERPRLDEWSDHELLVDTARDGIYALDAAGRFEFVNESLASMLGYVRRELVGTHISAVLVAGELEKGQRILQEVLEDAESESEVHDLVLRTNDGDRIVVEINYTVRSDDRGNYVGVTGVMRDVTEQRRQERELRSQRERLDRFAGLVAHDLRNPLAVIQGNLRTFLDGETAGSDGERIREALSEAERMGRLIENFLEMGRAGDLDPEPVELEAAVAAAFRRIDAPDASLRTTDLPRTVTADRDRLVQLLENLVGNAVEHSSTCSQDGSRPDDAVDHGGADVTIEIGAVDDRDGFYVADDGPGIPPERRDAVFDHGVTTDEDGTGFGLTIVATIAEAHGWDVAVAESRTGGARIEVTWPDVPLADRNGPTVAGRPRK